MKKYSLSSMVTKKIAALAAVGLLAVITVFGQNNQTFVMVSDVLTRTWATLIVTVATIGTANASDVNVGDDLIVIDDTTLQGDLTVGGGTTFSGILSTNVAIDFGACGTNETVTVSVTLPGATTNSAVAWNLAAPHTSFAYSAFVTAADTITVSASNISITNAINQAATVGRFSVIKY